MGQVNVNTPGGGTAGEPPGSTGAGMILGIIVAIIVIAALVYFLVLNPGNGGGDTNGGDTNGGGEPAPSGWMLTDHA
jgi:peptidoglycan/LPS O-acetylase OafA/YrhL